MKQATGELNLTLVVLIAIGVLLAFFYGVIWPNIKTGLSRTENCNNAICDKSTFDKQKGSVTCRSSNGGARTFSCPWKG